jgi:dTDP-glucose 4,6-dehydratase
MTTVLLTGAGGFAGHHLLHHLLLETRWDIVATDSFRHRGKTDRITALLDWDKDWRSRVDVITHDLSAPFSAQMTHRIAGAHGLDYLIAMASESHVDRSIADPVPFIQNNVNVMLNTLELARDLKPAVVLVISTDEVFGPGGGHKEWDPLIPSNPYSASKAAQEAIAVSYWRTYGVPAIITNTVNMYGERQDPEKFLPLVISRILAGKKITVHGTPDDIGSRYYIHARNAADAWLFLLGNAVPSMFPVTQRPDRYNISPAFPMSNLELAQLTADTLDMPLDYELADFHSARPGHDPHYGLDATAITTAGWKPPVGRDESLKRTINWYLEHPDWLL